MPNLNLHYSMLSLYSKKILIGLFLVIAGYLEINAQVTIGSEIEPAEGAILQIKQFEVTDAKSDGKSTSQKGLLMPKVALQDLNMLEPTAVTSSENLLLHRGMVVYNTTVNTTKELKEGVYIFDGVKWNKQITDLPITATTEPWQVQGSPKPAISNLENIYQIGSVSIGSQYPVPATYKLQVSGNTNILGNVRATGNASVEGDQAILNNQTIGGKQDISGELSVTGATTLNTTSINGVFKYKRSAPPIPGQFLKALNTDGTIVWGDLPSSALAESWKLQGGGTTTAVADNVYRLGSVNIGSSTIVPSAYKLQVAGAVNIKGYIMANSTILSGNNLVGGNLEVSGNAKIGNQRAVLNPSAQLELTDKDKGFLINRVALVSSSSKEPIAEPETGMLVFNTALSSDVYPGIYYWSGTSWLRMKTEAPQLSADQLNLSENCVSTGNTVDEIKKGTEIQLESPIVIPETGSYVFSWRLTGNVGTKPPAGEGSIYYIALMIKRRGITEEIVEDSAEIDIVPATNHNSISYSLTLRANANVGDTIFFRLSHDSSYNYPWTLSAAASKGSPKRSSLVWRKLK